MTCVSRWWITAWVLGLAPWGLIRRGHCMSGKQEEPSPGNIVYAWCVLLVRQAGKEVWGAALKWTEKRIHLTSTASLMRKLDKSPVFPIWPFRVICKEHYTFIVIWVCAMNISYLCQYLRWILWRKDTMRFCVRSCPDTEWVLSERAPFCQNLFPAKHELLQLF